MQHLLTRLTTKEELASLLHVSPNTVLNWIANGCPHLVISPTKGKRTHVRFDPEAVKEWLAEHTAAMRGASTAASTEPAPESVNGKESGK